MEIDRWQHVFDLSANNPLRPVDVTSVGLSPSNTSTTFSTTSSVDELAIDFLKEPQRRRRIDGARAHRLLYGSPIVTELLTSLTPYVYVYVYYVSQGLISGSLKPPPYYFQPYMTIYIDENNTI